MEKNKIKDGFVKIIMEEDNNEVAKYLFKSFSKEKNTIKKSKLKKILGFIMGKVEYEKAFPAISKIDYMNLKQLDIFILNHAIARMNTIIESFKAVGTISIIISLLVAYMTVYETFLKGYVGETVSALIVILLLACFIFPMMRALKKDKLNMLIAIYFKAILEDIKREKLNQI